MDKMYDPYNFNLQNGMQPNMQNMTMPDMDMMQNNPMKFYEQQYMYYKYLTQMLEYKIKLKEFEMMTKDNK